MYYLQIDEVKLSRAQIEEAAWCYDGVGFTYYIFDIDVNDGYKEIGIFFDGPNTPAGVYLYRFADGRLYYIGGFRNAVFQTDIRNYEAPGLTYEDMVKYISRENYLISVPGDGTVYCREITHLLQTQWFVSEYHLQNGAAYEYVPDENWGDGWVRIFYTVNEMWDSEAWIYVTEEDNIRLRDKELESTEVFENLNMAG